VTYVSKTSYSNYVMRQFQIEDVIFKNVFYSCYTNFKKYFSGKHPENCKTISVYSMAGQRMSKKRGTI